MGAPLRHVVIQRAADDLLHFAFVEVDARPEHPAIKKESGKMKTEKAGRPATAESISGYRRRYVGTVD